MENATKTSGKNREKILLIVIALVGAIGLLTLQFARKTPAAHTDERSMVQSGAQQKNEPATVSAPVQKIPGDLIDRSEVYPEEGQPFIFEMNNFAQGAIYELDPGDGKGRRRFVNGKLTYTYARKGKYEVSLYARYEGQEIEMKLGTYTKRVIVPKKPVQIEDIIDN